MALTSVFAVIALLLLGGIFGIMYKLKGAKAAWIATGISLAVLAVVFVGMIAAIVSVMPN